MTTIPASARARVSLGPDVKLPPLDDPPPGTVVRISVERAGVGPWTEGTGAAP